MSFIPYTGGSYNGWPRFTPQAWTAAETTTYAIAMATAFTRTVLRFYYFRRVTIDDVIMFIALTTLTAVFGLSCYMRDYIYAQVAMNVGVMLVPSDPVDLLRVYMKWMVAMDTLTWATIFLVKISYLVFFWRLIDRVRWIRVVWWTIFAIVVSAGVVCVTLPSTICTHLDDTMFENCSYWSLWSREESHLQVNVALDISTDIAVISLPLTLLYQVRLTLVRKLAVGAILCLSVIMIVIASIRMTYAMLPFGVTDTVWQSFWQTIEANVAVTMVSITGFRSLFGQVSRNPTLSSPFSSVKTFMRRGSTMLSSKSSSRKSPDPKDYIEKTIFIRTTTEVREKEGNPAWIQRPPHTHQGYERQPIDPTWHSELLPYSFDCRYDSSDIEYWGEPRDEIEAMRPLPSLPKRL